MEIEVIVTKLTILLNDLAEREDQLVIVDAVELISIQQEELEKLKKQSELWTIVERLQVKRLEKDLAKVEELGSCYERIIRALQEDSEKFADLYDTIEELEKKNRSLRRR